MDMDISAPSDEASPSTVNDVETTKEILDNCSHGRYTNKMKVI